jgi:hypothetical protein
MERFREKQALKLNGEALQNTSVAENPHSFLSSTNTQSHTVKDADKEIQPKENGLLRGVQTLSPGISRQIND